MSVDRLFDEFVASGGDPAPFLEQVSGPEREALIERIDAYLASAPRRPFDRARFEASAARPVAEALGRSLAGSAGTWPALLPRLRDRARLRRADVVSRLAIELDAPGREAKIAGYYHAMEQGTLPASGVSDRVLEALGRIVGESAAVLRAAGRALTPRPAAPGAPAAFARMRSEGFAAPVPAPSAEPPAERDEIDALFTSGHDG
jgi:hypothetical protein